MTDFEQLYNEYFKDVYGYMKYLSRDNHIAEDITSETFLKAIKNIDSFKGDCDIRVWLCQIAKNTYYTYLRKNEKLISFDNILEQQDPLDIVNSLTSKEASMEIHILPLYVENIVSEDTKELVDEHLLTCSSCNKALEEMREDNGMELNTDVSAFNLVKSKIRKSKIKTTSFFVILTLFILTIGFSALTIPNFLTYSKENITLQKDSAGNVIVSFGKNVSDYLISKVYNENGLESYDITIWNTFLSRNITKKTAKSFVLNASDKNVDGIWYHSPDSNMIWIASDNHTCQIDGVILPRLVLNAYLSLAAILTFIIGVIYITLFKFKKIQKVVLKIFYLPLAYGISSLCIGGLSNSTYTITRDFSLILLSTVLLYAVILLGTNLYKENKLLKQ